jgi:ribonuclease P protein component
VLSAQNRLRSSKDFARVTKTGHRATTASLVLYLKNDQTFQSEPQIGLIVSKAIGGSVIRHSVARKLRHASRGLLPLIPQHSQLVIRVIGASEDYPSELEQTITKISSRLGAGK